MNWCGTNLVWNFNNWRVSTAFRVNMMSAIKVGTRWQRGMKTPLSYHLLMQLQYLKASLARPATEIPPWPLLKHNSLLLASFWNLTHKNVAAPPSQNESSYRKREWKKGTALETHCSFMIIHSSCTGWIPVLEWYSLIAVVRYSV